MTSGKTQIIQCLCILAGCAPLLTHFVDFGRTFLENYDISSKRPFLLYSRGMPALSAPPPPPSSLQAVGIWKRLATQARNDGMRHEVHGRSTQNFSRIHPKYLFSVKIPPKINLRIILPERVAGCECEWRVAAPMKCVVQSIQTPASKLYAKVHSC